MGLDPWSLAALQARALLDAGVATERDFAEVVARNRANAVGNEYAQVSGKFDVDALLAEPYVRNPLRRHDLPPISDGAAAVVLAAGDRAAALVDRPAWITGIDHRIDIHQPGMRDLTVSPSTTLAARGAGVADRPVQVAELSAPFSPQEVILRNALGLDGSVEVNPSGGALAANPVMVTGLVRVIEAARQVTRAGPRPGARPRHRRPGAPTEPRLHPGGIDGEQRARPGPPGVIGIGQTKYSKARTDVSIPGLVREAAGRALDDAGLDWGDIDALVMGKAPDIFEGVMQPELFLADALGAAGKPMLRVHTAGSVGCSTANVATDAVKGGRFQRVLAVAWEKQAEGNAQWGLGGGKSGSMGAGGIFAPWVRAYISRSGAPEHIGWKVAVKDRLNAVKNPYAHLKLPDITIEKVRDSMMLWDPIHFLESCPSSDGACAIVVADHDTARRTRRRRGCCHRDALGARSVPGSRHRAAAGGGRLQRRASTGTPASPTRASRSTSPSSTCPFSWYEPMWLEGHDLADPGEGWKMTDDGATEMTGSFPVNPSGGVLSSNPIGASGMIRFAEAALQVQGKAGEHQVEGARGRRSGTRTVRWRNTSPWRCCRRRRRPGRGRLQC